MSGNHTHRTGTPRLQAAVTLLGIALAVAALVAWGLAVTDTDDSPDAEPSPGTSAAAKVETTTRPSASPYDPGHRSSQTKPQGEGVAHGGDGRGEQQVELGWAAPVHVSIPRIRVSSGLEDLELDPSGAMTTPQDPSKAGWFTPGPAPGIEGTAVIAGHVTWDQQPAVFYRLGQLRKGDVVRVARDDGSTAVFEVTRVAEFDKDAFPTAAVYGHTDRPSLRLITCGGDYDSDQHRYLANVVVWAHLVGATRA